jgi:hypothetical protein
MIFFDLQIVNQRIDSIHYDLMCPFLADFKGEMQMVYHIGAGKGVSRGDSRGQNQAVPVEIQSLPAKPAGSQIECYADSGQLLIHSFLTKHLTGRIDRMIGIDQAPHTFYAYPVLLPIGRYLGIMIV